MLLLVHETLLILVLSATDKSYFPVIILNASIKSALLQVISNYVFSLFIHF